MVALDSVDRNLQTEDAAVKRDYEGHHREEFGDESTEETEGDDGMRVLAAGDVTINQPPAEKEKPTPSVPLAVPVQSGSALPTALAVASPVASAALAALATWFALSPGEGSIPTGDPVSPEPWPNYLIERWVPPTSDLE